jgi:hypothetical protein
MKYFFHYYTLVWDQPQPRTRYDIYAVGEFDNTKTEIEKDDDTYNYTIYPTKIIGSNLMPKDFASGLNMSAGQYQRWTFENLDTAKRYCIGEIFK